jgi:copper homeostasis protein CutC
MLQDVALFKEAGANAIVFGILTKQEKLIRYVPVNSLK